MQLTGSEIVIECLKEQGVDTVFGYPGGAILNIYDALYEHQNEIRHILTSHEQGAAHAADGYARANGKVGVCMATSGPGATNLVTGIATAYMDSVPVVAITANVGTSLLGRDSFQEIDIASVVMPITKHSFTIRNVTELADSLRRAFTIAQSGRPGPVLVVILKDVTSAVCEFEPKEPEPIEKDNSTILPEDIAAAVKMIDKAERPVIYVGGGANISGASEEVRELAYKINAPVTDSLMGKGAFPGEDDLYMGMLGMHGTKAADLGVTASDLLITVGARFSDRATGKASKFAKNTKILQIDIDPAEINKNIIVDASIVGDIKEVLKLLNKEIQPKEHTEWLEQVQGLKDKYPLTYPQGRLTGPYAIEELYRVTNGDAIVVTDVGQHQMWAAQFYKFKESRTLITSGGLGTMGFGLGAAIGVKIASPDKVVVNVAGDGCFRMNMNEISTAVRNNVPIIQLVLNNHVLGMVRQWQTLFYEERYSNTILDDPIDFVKIAEAMGAVGIRVTKCSEIGPALEKAIALKKPVVIDCIIESDDKVFPMVPSGIPLSDVFDEEDLKTRDINIMECR